jgi:hypothetical protein
MVHGLHIHQLKQHDPQRIIVRKMFIVRIYKIALKKDLLRRRIIVPCFIHLEDWRFFSGV